MRMAILAAVAVAGLGFAGSAAVSAAPVYGTSMAPPPRPSTSPRTSGGGIAAFSCGAAGGARATRSGVDRSFRHAHKPVVMAGPRVRPCSYVQSMFRLVIIRLCGSSDWPGTRAPGQSPCIRKATKASRPNLGPLLFSNS